MSTILVRLDAPATSVTAPLGTPNAAASADRAALVALPPTARADPDDQCPGVLAADSWMRRAGTDPDGDPHNISMAWPSLADGAHREPRDRLGADSRRVRRRPVARLAQRPTPVCDGRRWPTATADYRETRSARTSQRFTDGPGWGSARTCAGSGPVVTATSALTSVAATEAARSLH